MPWEECNAMSRRQEFVMLANAEGANKAALCRRFGISRRVGYKWLERYQTAGVAGLGDRSRRPKTSPRRTPEPLEAAVVAVRLTHPAWGGRKIRRVLQNDGVSPVPAVSTVTDILHRSGLIDPAESAKHVPFIRFEHAAPNDLLQMDFKGHFAVGSGRCHPLTVVDDHSRFGVVLKAIDNERGDSVKTALTEAFRIYGLPRRMTMDNGAPWGAAHTDHGLTPLVVWLIRLGIKVSHSRPYHPQTQGKNERFNGTLLREVIAPRQFTTMAEVQAAFDRWRDIYNHQRPHEGIALAVPADRYQVSPREFSDVLPPITYPPGVLVRRVQQQGYISFKGRILKIPKALAGYPVAIEPSLENDGVTNVRFLTTLVATFTLNAT